jgi:Fe-S cluster assembly iron-binding protein IscA
LVLDEPKDDDERVEADGLTFLINKDLASQSGEVKVDFVDTGWQQGFTVTSEKPVGGGASACGSCSC